MRERVSDCFFQLHSLYLSAKSFAGLDPYYEDVVKADEEEFIDTSKSRVLFGWEEVYIDDGKLLGYTV